MYTNIVAGKLMVSWLVIARRGEMLQTVGLMSPALSLGVLLTQPRKLCSHEQE